MTVSCARCGKKHPAEKLSFSRHSRKHYCLDTEACARRMKRLERQGAKFDRGFLVELVA